MVFKVFESGIFLKPEELKQGTGLKILTPKQMLQRLPMALAQIKVGIIQKVYCMKSGRLFILCINQKKLPKKYIIT